MYETKQCDLKCTQRVFAVVDRVRDRVRHAAGADAGVVGVLHLAPVPRPAQRTGQDAAAQKRRGARPLPVGAASRAERHPAMLSLPADHGGPVAQCSLQRHG